MADVSYSVGDVPVSVPDLVDQFLANGDAVEYFGARCRSCGATANVPGTRGSSTTWYCSCYAVELAVGYHPDNVLVPSPPHAAPRHGPAASAVSEAARIARVREVLCG